MSELTPIVNVHAHILNPDILFRTETVVVVVFFGALPDKVSWTFQEFNCELLVVRCRKGM